MKVSVTGKVTKLHDLVTGADLTGRDPPASRWPRRSEDGERRKVFDVHLMPHSYSVFAAEQ